MPEPKPVPRLPLEEKNGSVSLPFFVS